MAEKYYLAIDIGASSGRHILGHLEGGKLVLEEVYRFKNGAVEKNGKLVWDHNALFSSIVAGLKECGARGKIPCMVGIDTWGVDYALLDKNGELIGEIYSYRDDRTLSVTKEVAKTVGEERLYKRTGIQEQVFNTIYQLYCDKKSGKLDKAETFLMTPDYLHYMLTGVKKNEYTNASTTGLLNAAARDWDMDIIGELGLKKELFRELSMPGTVIGDLKEELVKEVGFNTKICLPATHDTASAVLAAPLRAQNTSEAARSAGFTNEGGYGRSVRFLKNIMGLWIINECRREWKKSRDVSFSQIVDEAKKISQAQHTVEAHQFEKKKKLLDMLDYLEEKKCRRRYLLRYFGETMSEKPEVCCDLDGAQILLGTNRQRRKAKSEESWQKILEKIFKE